MKTCTVFCAGQFHGLVAPVEPQELIIAADGGLEHLKELNMTPTVILGDFDSLGYVPEGARVFPVEKDDTDSMLAVRYGLTVGCDRFILYGALDGPRPDHTVANLQTLQFLADHGAAGYLVGKDFVVTVLKNGLITFPKETEGILSVFCLGAAADGVTIEGLKYTLTDGMLTPGFPLGVSNHFVGKMATVRVRDGSLILFYPRKAGIVPCLPMN